MPIRLSRRAVLLGGASVAALAGTGVIALSSFGETDLMRATLRRLVGDFRMAEAELAAFTRDFLPQFPNFGALRSAVLKAGEMTGLAPLMQQAAPAAIAERMEHFERQLLTAFATSTTYLQLADPASEPVEYLGTLNACSNPFARFEPDETSAA
jgi:hypothetical protein